MRRGRPKHPDILTPRQWQVLELLRQGLTNEQIARRLGLTLDGAKYHVSEIITKLGVEGREEAAAWQPPASNRFSACGLSFLLRVLRMPSSAKLLVGIAFVASTLGVAVLVAFSIDSRRRSTESPGELGQPVGVDWAENAPDLRTAISGLLQSKQGDKIVVQDGEGEKIARLAAGVTITRATGSPARGERIEIRSGPDVPLYSGDSVFVSGFRDRGGTLIAEHGDS